MPGILLDKHLWIVSGGDIGEGGIAAVLLLQHFFFFFGDKLTKRRKSASGTALLKQVKLLARAILVLAARRIRT